jgi:hypothetical protein
MSTAMMCLGPIVTLSVMGRECRAIIGACVVLGIRIDLPFAVLRLVSCLTAQKHCNIPARRSHH